MVQNHENIRSVKCIIKNLEYIGKKKKRSGMYCKKKSVEYIAIKKTWNELQKKILEYLAQYSARSQFHC